ncbi:MAG: DUF1028 domain-containing protein [Planctomycetota bacterium]
MKRSRCWCRRVALALSVLLVFAVPSARATWSIIVYNSRTGEIGVASATCLQGFDLKRALPVVLVGVGAACAQSAIDSGAFNRRIIREELLLGTPPETILEILEGRDFQHQSRQYGILDSQNRTSTFTGSNAGAFAGGLIGHHGDLHYAIQGNVITGRPVIEKAEELLISTPGDIPEKLLAAMEAARSMGGDGRCSCDGRPDSCGSPPADFVKSADVAFAIVARLGDIDGFCSQQGCARGTYFMDLNVPGQQSSDPDPVIQLHKLFAEWRQSWVGRPDHVMSVGESMPHSIPADGRAMSTLDIRLVDWRGKPLTKGGATVTVTHAEESAGSSMIGAVSDHGDGTYSVPLMAGDVAGIDVFDVRIDDGRGLPAQIAPKPTLELFSPSSGGAHRALLRIDRDHVSLSEGGELVFELEAGHQQAGRPYILLGSFAGTQPGVRLGRARLPLNPDAVLAWTLLRGGSHIFPGGRGTLDENGEAAARLRLPATTRSPWIDAQISFAFIVGAPFDLASKPVPVRVTD